MLCVRIHNVGRAPPTVLPYLHLHLLRDDFVRHSHTRKDSAKVPKVRHCSEIIHDRISPLVERRTV